MKFSSIFYCCKNNFLFLAFSLRKIRQIWSIINNNDAKMLIFFFFIVVVGRKIKAIIII